MHILYLCVVVSIGIGATCTIVSNTEHFTETYSINTSGSCNGGGYMSPPICSIASLNRKLRIAERVLHHAMNEVVATIRSSSMSCHEQNTHNLPLVPSTRTDLVVSLQTGIQMMTQVALNMSVTNCHTSGGCSQNVLQPIVDVICELKRMLMHVAVDPDIFRAMMSYNTMDRTEQTVFTCASLRTALEILRFLENDINRIFRNMP